MFKKTMVYIVVIGLLCAAIPAGHPVEASSFPQVSVTASNLNFRIGPGTQYWSLEMLNRGSTLSVLTGENGWYLVQKADGTTGWIAGWFTSNSSAVGPLSLNGIGKGTVSTSSLNIRTGPGSSFQSLDRLPLGTEMRILMERNGWLLVRLNYGSTGWVSGNFISGYAGGGGSGGTGTPAPGNNVTVNTAGLNYRLGPGTQYWSHDNLPQNTGLSVLASENGWFLVRRSNGATGWVSGSHTSNPAAKGTLSLQGIGNVWTSVAGLNIRTGPGSGHLSFDKLPMGTQLTLLMEENNWSLVRLGYGSTGWVSSGFTSKSKVEPPSGGGSGNALNGRVIVLDPGHGGTNPGAVGITGLRENIVVYKTSNMLAGYLRAQGARVVLTHENSNVSLAHRVNVAHNQNAHIFISIHANWHPNPAISGTETYYNSAYSSWASQRLAGLVQQELVRDSGLRNIGVKHATFYVIRNTRMPSILAELGFLSNYYDESLLRRDSFLDGQARAMSRAVISYFNS